MEDNEHIRLITKLLSRETSPDEEALLQQWLEADPEHRLEFNALRNIWDTGGEVARDIQFDTAAAWEKIAPSPASPSKHKSLPPALPSAKRTRSPLRLLSPRMIAAASALFALCIAAGWYYLAHQHPLQQVIAAADNQQLTLPDGSKIWLRQGAELKYPEHFDNARREVQLTGEAFFQPISDPARPFAIKTAHGSIEDIGTTFLVRNSDTTDEVLVITGKVKLTNEEDPSQSLVLSSGQKATILKNKLSPSGWGTPNMMSWKTGVLEFRQTPLDQIVQDINEHFGSKLAISPDLLTEAKTIKVTARFDHQPLEQALDEIKLTTGLHIMRIKDTLLFVRQ